MDKNDTHYLKEGMVVQIIPEFKTNPMFSCCMLVITELKSFGVQGYVQALGENGEMGGQAYIRLKFEEFEPVGVAVWIAE